MIELREHSVAIRQKSRHSKQNTQFARLHFSTHISLKKKKKHRHKRELLNQFVSKILKGKAAKEPDFLPLSPYCSERVQDLSRAEIGNRLLVPSGTTRLYSLAGRPEARARVHARVRDWRAPASVIAGWGGEGRYANYTRISTNA